MLIAMTERVTAFLTLVALTGCVTVCTSNVPPPEPEQNDREPLCFCLSPEAFDQMSMVKDPDGFYRIGIALNREHTEAFRVLTKENLGRDMLIVAGGQVVLEHRIDFEVARGGIVLGPFDTKSKAAYTMDLVESSMAKRDCNKACRQWAASREEKR